MLDSQRVTFFDGIPAIFFAYNSLKINKLKSLRVLWCDFARFRRKLPKIAVTLHQKQGRKIKQTYFKNI